MQLSFPSPALTSFQSGWESRKSSSEHYSRCVGSTTGYPLLTHYSAPYAPQAAEQKKPSIIFIDEVDALCSTRRVYSLLPRLLTCYSLLATPYLLLLTCYSLLPSAFCLLPSVSCRLPTWYFLLPTAFCSLTAYSVCLLYTAYCLLFTVYFHLPPAFSLLHTPYSLPTPNSVSHRITTHSTAPHHTTTPHHTTPHHTTSHHTTPHHTTPKPHNTAPPLSTPHHHTTPQLPSSIVCPHSLHPCFSHTTAHPTAHLTPPLSLLDSASRDPIRSEGESDSSRRLKNELLVRMSGASEGKRHLQGQSHSNHIAIT